MDPLAAEAIQIADKHLPGTPPARREALAKDILKAILRHSEAVAIAAIKTAAQSKRN